MSNRNIPKIRFKEFINKWNNYKLGQLGNFKSGIGFPDSQQGGTEGIPFFKVSDMNNIGNETEMRNANNYVTQEQIMKNSWKVINETPAIIFAKVGAALMLNRKRLVTKPFLIDNNTMSYSFDESWDKDFGLTLFQTINLPKYAQIGALPSYNASDIAMIKVNVPNIQEQFAIGSLFRTLDDLLASYKDNLANYQSLKATMLSKMFPKVGQKVPEIRLDGFEGEWEVKELGDVVKFYSGLTYKPSDVLSCGTLVLRSSNVRDGELIYIDNVFVNPDIVNCQNVKSGDIVVVVRNGSRDLIGKHALIRTEMLNTVIGAFMTGVRCDNPEFINALLDTKMFISEIHRNLGSTINQITTGNFKRMKFYFPLKDEQQAIGKYFTNLDNLISSHQEKISQLETLKKKLLQDMFI
jgi:restriction modification system DNA specificity domain protein